MIRFCPNCRSERVPDEIFCEGRIGDAPCNWDLSGEPLRPPGLSLPTTSPEPAPEPATPTPPEPSLRCTSGHAMAAGDLMCLVCGADLQTDLPLPAEPQPDPSPEPLVDGWRLLRPISHTDGVRERYIAEHTLDGRRGVLTLYHAGAEPDPEIYQVLRHLPREHVPEVLATGRWDDRAYEVFEELTGGTLADLGIVADDMEAVRHIVTELGCALHSLSEAGLRHRDLRPATLLVRRREPLDLVIGGFGSARLSEFDLDIVSPLDTSPYMAPEAIAGAVAAASDWWSLGMILLEQLTRGSCFEGVNPQAFLIHVLANGVTLPENLDPALNLLLRGLLARDRHHRWQWKEVQAWLAGEPVAAPEQPAPAPDGDGAVITLAGRRFTSPSLFALTAAEAAHWPEALDLLLRGAVATWAEYARLPPTRLAGLREVGGHEGLADDARLMLALTLLNPDMPLIHRGEIVTPGWLLNHPAEGYALISGPAPDLLERMGSEDWLCRLKRRDAQVRQRARSLGIDLNEEQLRVLLLSTSRARLSALWEERRRMLPDARHRALASLAERRTISEEDLIVLLAATLDQFRTIDEVIDEAANLATAQDVLLFEPSEARAVLRLPRLEIARLVDERTAGFARCQIAVIDGWVEQFRLERRLPLAQALVILAIPAHQWLEPKKQQYIGDILDFFEKKVAVAVLRGPLVRMRIGKTTARVDLRELDSERNPAPALLDHLLQRNTRQVTLDPSVFTADAMLEHRLHRLYRQAVLYKRDTGIDGLYLGFPFLLTRETRSTARTRIAPVLLWPVTLVMEAGTHGLVSLAFDGEREEVRLNPALETLKGLEACKLWRKTADELLGRSALKAADVMDAFGMLAAANSRILDALPSPTDETAARQDVLACSAVLFHVTFMGQAIGEDLRQLTRCSPADTGLETLLRLRETGTHEPVVEKPAESSRFFTVASDPSQETAVLQARQAPGLLVEGPPGTGKSQTIVNMVADAIGHGRSLLIVCQKHAALEVVYKRLVAERLDNRVVMLNDVNKDREPVIRAIREQLDTLFRATDLDPGYRSQRERLAARIEALEGELDRQHTALHRRDAQIGLSYREILGDLVGLEAGTPAVDAPMLRQRLAALDSGALAVLEEGCAPLARYWLPAHFESSPLVRLRAFTADQATLSAYDEAFTVLDQAEQTRDQALVARAASFDLDDPADHQRWILDNAATLLGLDQVHRQRLAQWLPLFRPANAPDAPGRLALQTLQRLCDELEQCDISAYAPALSPALATLPSNTLARMANHAAKVTAPVSWLGRLGPIRHIRRRKLAAFIAQHGPFDGDESLGALLRAARLEQQWRPLREALDTQRGSLGLPAMEFGDGPAQINQARRTLGLLTHIADLTQRLAAAPWAERLDAAMLTGQKPVLETLLADFDTAFVRHHARSQSRAALKAMQAWFEDSLLADVLAAIDQNRSAQNLLRPLAAAREQLAAYQQFRTRAARLSPLALEVFALLANRRSVLEAVPGTALETAVRRLINREARLAWKHRLEQETPELLLERSETMAKIAALAQADEEIRQLNRRLLRDGIDMAGIRPSREWDDITRLTGRRARRLREFIELGKNLGLMRLRPVWLMNPDVASRVLPLQPGLFDTVIYDEASQMPVEFALPTLFRARIAVVSGDEKQMPPTAFFASQVDNEESGDFDGDTPDEDASDEEREQFEDTWNRREIKDCPDLLQLARTALPVTTLQIHYRSEYRELIGFSNASFYGNRLSVPVRHPPQEIHRVKPLELIQVDGVYHEQSNEDEARQVVDWLAALWTQPADARPSVGVVTFNRKQADLIEDCLEQRAEEDDAFRSSYSQERGRTDGGEDMGVFVKNVENVQGDERDIIVFSSTFGRNRQGSFRRNFGVLGQSGGERRLNVAVTRARRRVVMLTSMPIGEISDMLATRHPPATPRDYLQAYMAYARALSVGEFATAKALLDRLVTDRQAERRSAALAADGFSTAVADFIQAQGWPLVPADDGDAFGLDFAIEDASTGLYAIGIECDAPRHRLLSTARAREIWRPSVLRRAVPRVHRVSSQAWYHDGDRERERLQTAIESALRGGGTA